jgi:2-phospho-L-lactate/phosphoenolpyruvate guanylyltransferase
MTTSRAAIDRIAAIVPVGTLAGAKTRLGETLDAEERQDLVVGLLTRTVAAALAVERLDDVLVVSPDRELLRCAAELEARTLRQRSRGLNAGLREGREDVLAGGATSLLVLPIDLPFVSPDAIVAVLAALTEIPGPAVVLVPDRHGTGTNALGLRPPNVIEFAFGRASRAAHEAAAAAVGATYHEVEGPLTVDLDTPDDYVTVEAATREGVRAR